MSINIRDIQEKAVLARHAAKIAALNSNVRLEWPDDKRWIALAAKRNVRLPGKTALCTSGKIERYVRKLGLSSSWFRSWCGYSYQEWINANPLWSLRALAGLLLEETSE